MSTRIPTRTRVRSPRASGGLSGGSASPELRPPLLGEGLHALLVVLAVEAVGDQLVEERRFTLLGRLDELIHRCFGRADRERRMARDGRSVLAREALDVGPG